MIATVLLILATWLVLGSALTYVLLAGALRRDEQAARADLDRELRTLIEQHQT